MKSRKDLSHWSRGGYELLITLWSGRLTFWDFDISAVPRTESRVLVLGNLEVMKCDVSWSRVVVTESSFHRFRVHLFGSLEDRESGCIALETLKSRNMMSLWSRLRSWRKKLHGWRCGLRLISIEPFGIFGISTDQNFGIWGIEEPRNLTSGIPKSRNVKRISWLGRRVKTHTLVQLLVQVGFLYKDLWIGFMRF
jgi:hypothetical protein